MKSVPEVISIPAKLPACADLLYKTREKRYALQHQVEELTKTESALKARLMSELAKAEAEGISGKLCRVAIVLKPTPMVQDWEALYKYIGRTKSFELLQKRLSSTAVKERWDAKKEVPGVGREDVAELSIHKV